MSWLALLPQHRALLEASGITREVADARGYRSVDVKARLAKYGFGPAQRLVPGLLIPVRGLDGRVVLHQFRPDEPRSKDGKPVKYETPSGARMVIDVPPMAKPWIDDPARPLWITEGARKADAAVVQGLCCVALLGVWSWRGTNGKGGKVALPDWESIALNDRDVYLVFDSDIVHKKAVQAALARLRSFLQGRGATVRVVRLPSGPGGVKTGLDDFLAAGHAVDDLLARASDELPSATVPESTEQPPGEPVDGGTLLNDLSDYFRTYVVMSPEAADVAALWTVHVHALPAFDYSPRLGITSPIWRCGKTVLVELVESVVPRPESMIRPSEAVLFRTIDAKEPALLLDEIDTVFGTRGHEPKEHEGIRALLNAGNRRGATIPRSVGPDFALRDFNIFAATLWASIGMPPPTVVDRSIVIQLRRKKKAETVAHFRRRDVEPVGAGLRDRAARWASQHVDALRPARPSLPEQLNDRAQDNWEPLLAIADQVGGDWPTRARQAALALANVESDDDSIVMRLLADCKEVLPGVAVDGKVFSSSLVDALKAIETGPWADYGRGGLTQNGLSRFLNDFAIRPTTVRIGDDVKKGYKTDDFEDAFARYVPTVEGSDDGDESSPPGDSAHTTVTAVTSRMNTRDRAISQPLHPDGCNALEKRGNAHGQSDVTAVTVENHQDRGEGDEKAFLSALDDLVKAGEAEWIE